MLQITCHNTPPVNWVRSSFWWFRDSWFERTQGLLCISRTTASANSITAIA